MELRKTLRQLEHGPYCTGLDRSHETPSDSVDKPSANRQQLTRESRIARCSANKRQRLTGAETEDGWILLAQLSEASGT